MNKDFELSLKENTYPPFQGLLTFLEKHQKGLSHINEKIYQKEDNVRKTFKTHQLGTCQEFAKLTLDDRIKFVKSKNICINCLGLNHYANQCKLTTTCRVCNKKHHSSLHNYNFQRRQSPILTIEHKVMQVKNKTSIRQYTTHLIKVFNSNNDELICRALIDSGAQKSSITKTLADKLNITQEHTKVKIAGFNSNLHSQVHKMIKIKLSSIYDNFKFETKALIVKDLSNKIPKFYMNNPVWPYLNYLKLADLEFYIH
ncbi:hypothetical protein LAZ67_1006849 [Cordylochernes scorpioides]|uniref:Peptidase A2 domain-containing protein n=1 Tax=Cordylochernes scorpioides TaxID=51811 RepID=A0ABY6JZ62_9ARAC|nr:hypothetical protein LAZ67_1006849 [Cordylochernes scorpioides]